MATPADQMFNQAEATFPQGPEQDALGYQGEIVGFDGGYEEEETHPLLKYLDQGNIVDELEDNSSTASKILELYHEADQSMLKWKKKYKRAINLAKMQAMSGDVEIGEKTFPFEGASTVMLPYITEAMLDFSSRASPELVWRRNIVDAQIFGENNDEKNDRAERVTDYMNYQLSELIPNWKADQDKGLMILACPGTFYKETYFDHQIQEVCSDLCLADEVIFNHNCPSFEKAPDKFKVDTYTHNEVISLIRGDDWKIEEDELNEEEDKFEFIKAYTWIDLDDDGLKEPYQAIIWEEKGRVVSLYPCFDEDSIMTNDDEELVKVEMVEKFTQYRFLPDPEGGPMGMGWGILLGPMFDSINTNMRQLIDAGTLSNVAGNSGLINADTTTGRGNSIQSGPIEVKLGQLTPVPTRGGGNLAQNVVQFPFAGPNQTLFQLMEYLVQSARSMTNAAISVEASPGEAASLYMARLQQGLKVPNSIIMRVYEAAKKEFQKIAELNYKHFDSDKYNRVIDADIEADMEADFNPDDCDIRLVSDPTQGSDLERVQRAQAVFELASNQSQQVINYRQAVLDLLESMNTPNIEELAPEPDPNAVDPMQQMLIAQQQMEAEMRNREIQVRESELAAKQQKIALEAAKEMSKLGMEADKTEADITKTYSETLKNLVDAGIASAEQAQAVAKSIEDRFIDNRGSMNAGSTAIPASDQGQIGDMAGQPSNQGIPTMPPMDGGGNI